MTQWNESETSVVYAAALGNLSEDATTVAAASMPSVGGNGTNATGYDEAAPDMTAFYVWDILFAAIILVAVIGNLIVIWIVFGKSLSRLHLAHRSFVTFLVQI